MTKTNDIEGQKSSNPASGQKQHKPWSKRLEPFLVWLSRIMIGAIFTFSGFAKCIDPRGFIYKINEYLNVWGIHWLWQESVMTIAVTISAIEFGAGVMMLTGCLRRTMNMLVLAFMAFMVPLTFYIMIANPVSDCGCFGDALIISNKATFIKNIVITIAAIYLVGHNRNVDGVYPPLVQWMVIVATIFYSLTLAVIGITIQPLIDFRPYKIGTQLIDNTVDNIVLTYEKDGITQDFNIENLPDSTWTYVGRKTYDGPKTSTFAIFEDDNEVTADVIDTQGPQVLLVIPEPKLHTKSRSSMANNINDYVNTIGGSMIGIIGADNDALTQWEEVAKPHFPVYTSDDTTLKELVRGDAGIVYLVDGRIVWKRNLFSLSGDFPNFMSKDNELDKISAIDSGSFIKYLSLAYISILAMIFMLGLIRIKKKQK